MIGSTQEVVLLAVSVLKNDVKGETIKKLIFDLTGHTSKGALFTVIKTLVSQGYLTYKLSDESGRPCRLYSLTTAGAKALLDAEKLRKSILLHEK